MSQFIETIRVEQGQLMACQAHQHRMNDTLIHFGAKPYTTLSDIECPIELSGLGLVKCRVLYNLTELLKIEFSPYVVKRISTVAFVDIVGRVYSFKFSDRHWINDLMASSQTDEIIMYDDGIIKDASYANLAFFNGHRWLTPRLPLLHGTQREKLLSQQKIYEEHIFMRDMHQYTHVKFINAMMNWEESPVLEINALAL